MRVYDLIQDRPSHRVAVEYEREVDDPTQIIAEYTAQGYELRATGWNVRGPVLTFERRPWLEID